MVIKDRAISSSTGRTNGKSSNYQIFYQDLNTTDLLYRLVWDEKVAEEQRLSLTIPANQGSPVAVVASNATADKEVSLHVFYMTSDATTNEPAVVIANLACAATAPNCNITSNNVIAPSTRLASTSQLAAVMMDDGESIRVYYQALGGWVWVLKANVSDIESWQTSQIAGPAAPGTSIAASVLPEPTMLQVLFVCSREGLLRSVEYDDSDDPKDEDGKSLLRFPFIFF
jgi:hypothetical protein